LFLFSSYLRGKPDHPQVRKGGQGGRGVGERQLVVEVEEVFGPGVAAVPARRIDEGVVDGERDGVGVQGDKVRDQVLEEAVPDAPDREGRDAGEARAGRVEARDGEVAGRVEGGCRADWWVPSGWSLVVDEAEWSLGVWWGRIRTHLGIWDGRQSPPQQQQSPAPGRAGLVERRWW